MRFSIFLLIGVVLIALQTTVFQVLPEWIGMPDLLFLLIVFISINLRAVQGTLLVLLFGTGLDVCSGYFLGLYSISYFLIFLMIKGMSTALAINKINHQPPIVAVSYLMASGLVYMFSNMLAKEGLTPWVWGGILQRVLILIILVLPMNRFYGAVLTFCDQKPDKRSFFQQKSGNRFRPDNLS